MPLKKKHLSQCSLDHLLKSDCDISPLLNLINISLHSLKFFITYSFSISFWQATKDLNPDQRFWRPTCYRYTSRLMCLGTRIITPMYAYVSIALREPQGVMLCGRAPHHHSAGEQTSPIATCYNEVVLSDPNPSVIGQSLHPALLNIYRCHSTDAILTKLSWHFAQSTVFWLTSRTFAYLLICFTWRLLTGSNRRPTG